MTNLRIPVLGILNEHDRADAIMLAIVCGAPSRRVWSYVVPKDAGNKWRPLELQSEFTPLNKFNCHAIFSPSGRLTVLQLHPRSRAQYANGRTRPWQGKANETIRIHCDVVRYVHEAVEAEADARANVRRNVAVAP